MARIIDNRRLLVVAAVWLLVSSAGLVQCLDAEPSNGLGLCEGRPDSLFPDGGGGGGGFVACRAGHAHRLRCPPRQEFRGGHCRRYRADLEAERCSEADGVYTDYGSGCRGFFFCKGGRRTSFSCPGSMLFDWRLGRCRPATRVNCSKLHCDADGVFPDHAGGCRRYFRCSDGEREEMLCPQGQLFEADRCQNSSAVTCKGDDGCGGLPDAFYPAPGCHEFVLCVAGQVREFTCPSDLIFSRKKLACDYPDRSSCDPPKATCAPGSNGLHPLPGCREFLVCRDGHLLKVGSCPRGTAFDTATLDCRPAGSVQCLVGADGHDSEPECAGRPDGAYPDPGSTPTSYYACLGEAMVATGSCPDGSAFDPATQHCQAPGRPGLDGVAYGQYECEGRIGVFPDYRSSCRGYRVCADGLEVLHDCDEDLRFDAETGRCLPEASLCRPPRVVGTFKCSEDSPRLFVDQSTGCRFWHECVGTEGVSYACPRGQTFDPERMFCRLDISCFDVSPRETGVPSLTGTIKLVNETDSEVDCGYDAEVLPALDRRDFHVCSPGGTYTFRCPTGTVFDVDKNTCSVDRGIDATDLMLPGDDFSCEGRNDGLFPDESMAHECARYYVCEGGKKKTMLCPPGTRFNHVLLFCSSAVLCQVDRPAPVTTPAPATPQPTTTTATVTKTTLENLVTAQAFSPITAPPSTLAPAPVTPRAGRGNRRRGHRRRPRPTEGNYVGAVEAVTPLVRPATTPEPLLATGAVSARGSRQGGERRTTWAATWSGSWAATRAGTRGTTTATTAITTVITTPPPTRITTTVTTPAPTPTLSVAPAVLTRNEPEIEPSRVPEVHRKSEQEIVHEVTADVPPLSDTEYEYDFGVYAVPIAGAVTPSTSKPDGRAEGRPRSEAEVRTSGVPQTEPGNVALSPPEATLAIPVNDQLGIASKNETPTALSLDATTGLGPQKAPETILDRFSQSPPRLQADHNSKGRPGYVPDGSPVIGEGFVPQQRPGEVPHSLAEIDPYVEAQRNKNTESPFTPEKRPPVSSDLAVEKGLNVGPETSQTSAPYVGARHGSTTESGFAPESLPQSTVVYEPEDEPDDAPEGLPQTPQRGSARQPQNTKSTNAPEIEQQVTSDIVSQRGRGESQKIPPYVGARLPANSDSNLPTGTRQEARGDFSPEGGSDVALQRSTETPPYVGARHESRYQTTFAPESGQRVTPPYVGIRDHHRTKTTSAPGKRPQTTSDFSSEYGLGEVSTVAPSLQARRYPKTESQFPQEVGLQDTADFPRDHELDIAAKSYTESQPYVDAQYRRITKTTLPPEKGQQTTSDFASQYVTHKAADNSPGTQTPLYADTRDPLRIKTTSVPQNVPSVAPDYPSEYGIDEDSEIPPNVGARLDPTPEPQLPQGVKQQVTADVPRQHGSDFAPQRTTQTPPYVDAKQSPRTKTTLAPSTGQQVTSDLASEYGEDEVTGSSPGPHRYEGTRDYSRNKATSAPGTGRQVTSEFVSDYDIDKASEVSQDVGAQYQPKTEEGLPPVVGLRVPADVVAGDRPNAAQGNLPETPAFVGEHRATSKNTAAPLSGASVTPDFTPQHGAERVTEEPSFAGDGHHPKTQPKLLPPEIGQRVTAGSTQEGGPDEVPESLPEYPQSVSVRHHPQFKPTTAPETGPRVTSDFASEPDVDDLPETSPQLGDKSQAKTETNLAPAINSQVAKDFAPYYGTEKVLESTSEAPPNAEASLRPGYESTIAPGETPEVTEDVAPENVRIAAPERKPKITADVYPESPLQPDARFAPKNSQENTVGFAPQNAPRYAPESGPEPTDVEQKSGPQTVSQHVPVNQPNPTSGPTSYISPEYRESPRRETTPVYTDRITTKTRPLDAKRVKPQTPPTIPPDSIYVTVPVTPIPTVRTTTRAASRRTTSSYSRSGGWDATRAPSWAATRGSARGTSPPPARATTATLTPRATPPASRGGGRSRTRSTTQAPETFNAISFMTYAPTRRDRLSTVTPTTPRDDLAPPTRDDVTLLPFPQRHLEATRASRFKCPKGRSGFFADFRSGCRRYHICFKNSSQVHECPGALLFNPISQTCDLPDKVTCVPPRRRACPNCKTTSSSTGRRRNHAHGVPSGFHFECGDLPDGFYPDVARRCHVFYRCHNGHKFPHYCKRGLLFNSKTGNCDFEGSVECSAAGEQRSPNESA